MCHENNKLKIMAMFKNKIRAATFEIFRRSNSILWTEPANVSIWLEELGTKSLHDSVDQLRKLQITWELCSLSVSIMYSNENNTAVIKGVAVV